MARQELNLVGGFYKDPNLHWSAQDVLNWIPVPAEKVGTRTRFQFRDAPGFKPFVRITKQVPDGDDFITVDQGPIRGMRNVEGKLFVVAGTLLYQITAAGVAIPYGTVPGVGRVSMAHNQRGGGNQLLVANGSAGYVFDTSSLVYQKITDAGYPGAFIADFCDGYLTQVEPQGRYWLHSDLSQALDYNTFDQYEAEADPDRIISLHVAFREVLIFGADTIEPFVNTGEAQGTFQRAANTVIQCGCSAKFSPRTMDNAVFFLDDKRVVRRMDGYNPIRVSTVGIESALAECSRDEIAAAFAVTYEDRGHKIYYLTVPGRFTFGYDVLSGEWHRRSSPGMGRWRLNDLVFWNGKWIGGDFQSGRLYELDWAYSLDSCDELERERVAGVLSADQNPITLNEVELLLNAGGKESTCVAFPAQPEGPTVIAPPLPDGVVDNLWPGGTYTATGGTPPYTFTSRPGTVWPTGLGPMSAAGVVPSFTPTVGGAGTNIARVTDANGLSDDVTDTFSISADECWNEVISLLQFNEANGATTVTDLKGKTWALTGNAEVSTAHSALGYTGSLSLDGTVGTAMSCSHADWAWGTQDFTVEFFARVNSFDSTHRFNPMYVYNPGVGGGGDGCRSISTDWIFERFEYYVSALDNIDEYGQTVVATEVMQHYAYSRSAGVGRFFVNGVLRATRTDAENYVGTTINWGGTAVDLDNASDMYIAACRITLCGRYTEDFTPPTEPYPTT